MTFDEIGLRTALGRFCSGVTIVTASVAGTVHGMTANAFSSVSLSPPLVLVCVNRKARMHGFIVHGQRFGISILSDTQAALSQKFAGAENAVSEIVFEWCDGIAVIAGAIGHFICDHFSEHEAGDHTIFIGQVRKFATQPGEPLVYYSGRLGRISMTS